MSRRRRSLTRSLIAGGVTLGSLGVGVVGARLVQDRNESDNTSAAASVDGPGSELVGEPQLVEPADQQATVGAAGPSIDELIPVLEPVAVGNDPSIVDSLLEPPDLGPDPFIPDGMMPDIPAVVGGEPTPGIDGAETISDPGVPPDAPPGAGSDPADDGAGDGAGDGPRLAEPPLPPAPSFIDFDGSLIPFPVNFIDPCAGAEPPPSDPPPSSGCPDGVGGTVGRALRSPPYLNTWISMGHAIGAAAAWRDNQLCSTDTPAPAAGEDPVMIVTSVPLVSTYFETRPRGSTADWQTIVVEPATLPAQRAEWEARFEAGVLEPAVNNLIGRCVTVRRDQQQPYEMRAVSVDIFGRSHTTIMITLPDLTPEGRPPSVAEIDRATNRALVTGWTTRAGSIRFAWYPLAPGDTPAANCDGRRAFPFVEQAVSGGPMPPGVWDPQYQTGRRAVIQLAAGGRAVVCVTIYDTSNTLRPLATDVFVVQGPQAYAPRIDLMGVRLNDGVTIAEWDLSVAARYEDLPVPDDGCSSGWNNTVPLAGPGAAVGPDGFYSGSLWACDYTPLPLDSRGYVKVPITVSREVPGTSPRVVQRRTWGIPLQVDRCSRTCPIRLNEFYEIPIPTGDLSLRGCTFDCDAPPPSAGAAIIRVTWTVLGPSGPDAMTGATLLTSSTDRGPDPVGSDPRLALADITDFVPTTDRPFNDLGATATINADRTLTMVSASLRPYIDLEGSPCSEVRPIAIVDSNVGTEFQLQITAPCPGLLYDLVLTLRDAEGTEYVNGWITVYTPSVIGRGLQTRIEFLDDTTGRELGYLYEMDVFIDGSNAATPSYAWNWTGQRAIGERVRCVEFGATNVSTINPISRLQVISPERLYVSARFNFTTVCDNSGSGRGAIGVVELVGQWSFDDLASGEPLVLTTPADSRLQVRVTVTYREFFLGDGRA